MSNGEIINLSASRERPARTYSGYFMLLLLLVAIAVQVFGILGLVGQESAAPRLAIAAGHADACQSSTRISVRPCGRKIPANVSAFSRLRFAIYSVPQPHRTSSEAMARAAPPAPNRNAVTGACGKQFASDRRNPVQSVLCPVNTPSRLITQLAAPTSSAAGDK